MFEQTVAAATSHISPWLSTLLYPIGRYLVLPLYFKHIVVRGQEHFPTHGPVLVAPTHRSRWDALMIPYAIGRFATGRDLRFMVSSDEVQGIQGWVIRRFGGFPIDTDRPSMGVFRHSIQLLKAGEVLVMFPEGNIFRDRQVQNLKPGLARIALQAQRQCSSVNIHVLPIAIEYSPAVPQWGCDVQLKIGPPLNVVNYVAVSNKQAAVELLADLKDALNCLSHSPALDPKPVSVSSSIR